MHTKKFWSSLLAILVIASFVLAACSPKATPTEGGATGGETGGGAAEQPTKAPSGGESTGGESTQPQGNFPYENVDPSGQTIVFWHQHSRSREAALQEIVDEFNKTNEWGITVVAEYQGHYGDIFNKMLTFMNTPDVPNIVVAYQNQAATYQLADALVDMNALVDSPKWGLSEEDKADFFQGFYNQDIFPTFGGARLGFPPNRSMEVMYYNMDWLKELGYDAPPTTPDEFKEMACKAAQQPFSKATAEGSRGYELSIDASRFASWTFAFGGDVFD
ncbi:MAG: extracellular solute-binding protein, partial [Anaerolineae bacterium]